MVGPECAIKPCFHKKKQGFVVDFFFNFINTAKYLRQALRRE